MERLAGIVLIGFPPVGSEPSIAAAGRRRSPAMALPNMLRVARDDGPGLAGHVTGAHPKVSLVHGATANGTERFVSEGRHDWVEQIRPARG